jgi:hypothetical protein
MDLSQPNLSSSKKPLTGQEGLKVIEAEDDNGRIVQVSGGFGDSNSMDPETMQALREN